MKKIKHWARAISGTPVSQAKPPQATCLVTTTPHFPRIVANVANLFPSDTLGPVYAPLTPGSCELYMYWDP